MGVNPSRVWLCVDIALSLHGCIMYESLSSCIQDTAMCQEYSEDCTKASVEYAVQVIFQTASYVLPSQN